MDILTSPTPLMDIKMNLQKRLLAKIWKKGKFNQIFDEVC